MERRPPSTSPSHDWRSVFAPGDVVRSYDGSMIGIVLLVENYSDSDEPLWELHVDTAINRSCAGVSIWEPWSVYVDASAVATDEADAFGLRRPTQST